MFTPDAPDGGRRYISVIFPSLHPVKAHQASMNSIGNDPRIDRAGLHLGADRLGLDGLRDHGPGHPAQAPDAVERTGQSPVSSPALADPGEDVLQLAGWDGIAAGQRLLAGETGLERALGGLDLATAVDSAVDAVIGALD